MASYAKGLGKICVFCGRDCEDYPRGKDSRGRYYHISCLEESKLKQDNGQYMGEPPSVQVPEFEVEDEDGYCSSLVAEAEPDEVFISQKEATICPNCGRMLPPGSDECEFCKEKNNKEIQLEETGIKKKKPEKEVRLPDLMEQYSSKGTWPWPFVIGVVSVGYGVIGLGWALVSTVFAFIWPFKINETTGSLVGYIAVVVISLGIALWLTNWIIRAGRGILHCRLGSISSAQLWATVSIYIASITSFLAIVILVLAKIFTEELGISSESDLHFISLLNGIIIIVSVLIYCISWPIAILIWFSRESIKKEVTNW